MAENKSRHIFHLHGITGMLIATVLLLSILVVLTTLGLKTQQANATNFYSIEDAHNLQTKSVANAEHRKLAE